MFSQTVEYALRAVVCLAQQPDHPLTTQQIASVTKVPAGYLSKVLQALGRSEVVKSQRGIHGGFVLGALPSELTILQIVTAVDPIKKIQRCPLHLAGHQEQLCALHHRLNETTKLIETSLGSTTIADIINSQAGCAPMCEMRSLASSGVLR